MPNHWTYTAFQESDDLMQGDILSPTQELGALFKDVHPYFCDAKYLGFIVTTQSCDLDRKHGASTARYVNVAAIRTLSDILPALLDTVCTPLKERVYCDDDRSRADQLLKRVFNQNEQKLGLFYLFPDGDVGIGEDAVAFLRVSVAFRVEHYDAMRKARIGRLTSAFVNKLGWLVGNLYSRAATPDWPDAELRRLVSAHIGTSNTLDIVWVPKGSLEYVRKHSVIDDLDREGFLEKMRAAAPRTRDLAIKNILGIVSEVIPDMTDGQTKTLKSRLLSDRELTASFRH